MHPQQTPLYFMIMRLNLKLALILLCLAVFLITLTFWTHCGDLSIGRGFIPKWEHRSYDPGKISYRSVRTPGHHLSCLVLLSDSVGKRPTTSPVDCVINQEYSIACLQEGEEVYVPFSFLREYFEVYGSLSQVGKGPPRFDWAHSNAKVNYPKGTYDPRGIFMYFENYNVEVCSHFIHALDGWRDFDISRFFFFCRFEIVLNVSAQPKVCHCRHNGNHRDIIIQHKLLNSACRTTAKI